MKSMLALCTFIMLFCIRISSRDRFNEYLEFSGTPIAGKPDVRNHPKLRPLVIEDRLGAPNIFIVPCDSAFHSSTGMRHTFAPFLLSVVIL